MKEYWSIPGPKKSPKGWPCIAFFKHDGSNLRFEWSKKRGWYKFGTRRRLFDETDPEYGRAIPIFLEKFGDQIPRILKKEKEYRSVDQCIVWCEFEGEHSFAGFHDFTDDFDLILLDVNPYKKGIVPPRQFIKHFGSLNVPEVVYEGNFNQRFILDVREGKYPVKEGVVVKGIKPGGHPQHGLWMAKVKTLWWLDELRAKAKENEQYSEVLADNEREQAL